MVLETAREDTDTSPEHSCSDAVSDSSFDNLAVKNEGEIFVSLRQGQISPYRRQSKLELYD